MRGHSEKVTQGAKERSVWVGVVRVRAGAVRVQAGGRACAGGGVRVHDTSALFPGHFFLFLSNVT